MRAVIDQTLNKIVSRKLLVWVVGTVGLLTGSLNSGDWVTISIVYIGTQAAVDVVERLRRAKGEG